jgi:ATP-dependent RNA helicase DeaD
VTDSQQPEASYEQQGPNAASRAPGVIEPKNALPPLSLAELPEALRMAAGRAHWQELMPVQSKAIPYVLAGRDVMVQSRTGSGKTGAFILPILHCIDAQLPECQALVLVPTRELALQVTNEARLLSGDTVRTAAVYGGVGYGPQREAFRNGCQLIIGTPGRILDHLMRGAMSLQHLRILVLDEADRMLSMGFYPDMQAVKRYLPRRRYHGFMFSATMPSYVLSLAGEFLHQPDFLSLSGDHVHVSEVQHVYYAVPGLDKDRALVRIIESENPTSALIFCNTKSRVRYVTVVLQRFGYDADELSSDLSQEAREQVMGRVREGRLRFLVATDVAARGIDLPSLSHVIQYEPPEDAEAYIHRAGRTGRAGASGVAVTLVAAFERLQLLDLAKRFTITMEARELPTDEQVAAIVGERVTALLEARLRDRDKLQVERMQRFKALALSLGQNEDETALLAMLIDDYYQATLHAAPPIPAGASEQRRERAERTERNAAREGPRGGGGGGGGHRRGGRGGRGGRGR